MGRIFYIMGKSASGKDHFYEALLKKKELSLNPIVLYTTRPKRDGETDGREYYFVDLPRLEAFRKDGRVIEERTYQTIHGPWTYFTADDGCFEDGKKDYLGIGTLDSYKHLKNYFGKERLCPLYIEVEDGIRLERALQRERMQREPRYEELCRRFLADAQDFSEFQIQEAGIDRRFFNNETFEVCLEEIVRYILEIQNISVS